MPLQPAEPTKQPSEFDPTQIVTRFMRDDEVEAMAAFLILCFGRWPAMEISCSPAEHVAWKITKRTAIPEQLQQQFLSTTVDNPDVIISRGLRVGQWVWVRGNERLTNSGGDAAVHPDWRMLGLRQQRREFREEHRLQIQDISLSWLPHHPATRKRSLRRPETAQRVRAYWRPGGLRQLVSVPQRTKGWWFAVRTALAAWRVRSRERPAQFAGQIVDLERFDDRTDAIWNEAKHEFDVAFVRDQERQNWRYIDPRAGRFVARVAMEVTATTISRRARSPAGQCHQGPRATASGGSQIARVERSPGA